MVEMAEHFQALIRLKQTVIAEAFHKLIHTHTIQTVTLLNLTVSAVCIPINLEVPEQQRSFNIMRMQPASIFRG